MTIAASFKVTHIEESAEALLLTTENKSSEETCGRASRRGQETRAEQESHQRCQTGFGLLSGRDRNMICLIRIGRWIIVAVMSPAAFLA